MRIIDRLDKYMIANNLNDNQVTVNCALSIGLLGKARRGDSDLGKKAVDKILNYYQDLNRIWLITGEGEMAKPSKEERKISRGEHIKNVFFKSTDLEIEELIENEFSKHLLEMYEAGRAYPAVYVKELREDLQAAQQQIIELKRQNEVLRSEIKITRK